MGPATVHPNLVSRATGSPGCPTTSLRLARKPGNPLPNINSTVPPSDGEGSASARKVGEVGLRERPVYRLVLPAGLSSTWAGIVLPTRVVGCATLMKERSESYSLIIPPTPSVRRPLHLPLKV